MYVKGRHRSSNQTWSRTLHSNKYLKNGSYAMCRRDHTYFLFSFIVTLIKNWDEVKLKLNSKRLNTTTTITTKTVTVVVTGYHSIKISTPHTASSWVISTFSLLSSILIDLSLRLLGQGSKSKWGRSSTIKI